MKARGELSLNKMNGWNFCCEEEAAATPEVEARNLTRPAIESSFPFPFSLPLFFFFLFIIIIQRRMKKKKRKRK
jgi:hypothetical protein